MDASVKLVGALEHFQLQFVPKPRDPSVTSEDEDEELQDTKVDPLDAFNAQDVSYSIRRLIRGLASPRESSRLGFSVALTEVCLYAHTCIKCIHVQFVIQLFSYYLGLTP